MKPEVVLDKTADKKVAVIVAFTLIIVERIANPVASLHQQRWF
jgi:hypothetical protein